MSTHDICFYGEILKIILQLSSNIQHVCFCLPGDCPVNIDRSSSFPVWMKLFREVFPCLRQGIWKSWYLGQKKWIIELCHEIILCKLILQMRILSYAVEQDVWFLVTPFVYFHTSCVRTAKALASLHGCAGSPEPSLVAYVISTIISWAGSNHGGKVHKMTLLLRSIFDLTHKKIIHLQ